MNGTSTLLQTNQHLQACAYQQQQLEPEEDAPALLPYPKEHLHAFVRIFFQNLAARVLGLENLVSQPLTLRENRLDEGWNTGQVTIHQIYHTGYLRNALFNQGIRLPVQQVWDLEWQTQFQPEVAAGKGNTIPLSPPP